MRGAHPADLDSAAARPGARDAGRPKDTNDMTNRVTPGQYRGGPLAGQDVTGRRTAYRSEDGNPIRYRRSGRFNNLAINCHGALADDHWYEMDGQDYVHTSAGGSGWLPPVRRSNGTRAEVARRLATPTYRCGSCERTFAPDQPIHACPLCGEPVELSGTVADLQGWAS